MEVIDFNGTCKIEREDELLARLRTVRRGLDGAFILDHGGPESLWVHINGDVAFLYFFPDKDGERAGFVPDGMWAGEHGEVSFQLVDGTPADAITARGSQLVTLEAAYRAAVEFLHTRSLPSSVTWLEL